MGATKPSGRSGWKLAERRSAMIAATCSPGRSGSSRGANDTMVSSTLRSPRTTSSPPSARRNLQLRVVDLLTASTIDQALERTTSRQLGSRS